MVSRRVFDFPRRYRYASRALQIKLERPLVSSSSSRFRLSLPASAKRDAVSGTIEVDEVHVAPRMGGRVEKIFAREGDRLASRPVHRATRCRRVARPTRPRPGAGRRRQCATSKRSRPSSNSCAPTPSASRNLLRSRTVSPNEAERAASVANAQEKAVEATKMRVTQAKANLAQIETQLNEMKVTAPERQRPRNPQRQSRRRPRAQSRSRHPHSAELSLGPRLRPGAVARPHQNRRRSSRPDRFLRARKNSAAWSSRSTDRPSSRRAMSRPSKIASARSSA